MAEITAEAVEKRRKEKQAEAHRNWVNNNREYVRQYRKAWRKRYFEEHGTVYETDRARAKARAELEAAEL